MLWRWCCSLSLSFPAGSLSLLYSFSFFFFLFLSSLFSPTQGQRDPGRGGEILWDKERRGEKKKKEKDRQEASVGASAEMSNRKNQARKWWANLCFKTFPHIVSRAVRWEQGSESWWAFFFFCILHNNHQVRQQTHSLPIFSFCPLPDLSNCLASITFYPCPFTSPVSLMWHTHSTVNLFLSVTHTHAHTLTLFEFRPISANGTCSLCWLAHISFHLNLIWRESCHRRSRYQTSLNNRPMPISPDFIVEGLQKVSEAVEKPKDVLIVQNLWKIESKFVLGQKKLLVLRPWWRSNPDSFKAWMCRNSESFFIFI